MGGGTNCDTRSRGSRIGGLGVLGYPSLETETPSQTTTTTAAPPIIILKEKKQIVLGRM